MIEKVRLWDDSAFEMNGTRKRSLRMSFPVARLIHNNRSTRKKHRFHLNFELVSDSTLLELIYSRLLLILTIERLHRDAMLNNTSILTEFSHRNVETRNNQIEYRRCKRMTSNRKWKTQTNDNNKTSFKQIVKQLLIEFVHSSLSDVQSTSS
jgi:hypothetical protein